MTTNLMETMPYARELGRKGTRSTVLESSASLVAEIMTSRRTERSKLAMIRPIIEFVKGPVDRKKQADLAEQVHDGKSLVEAVFTPSLASSPVPYPRRPVPLRESAVSAWEVCDGQSLVAAIF